MSFQDLLRDQLHHEVDAIPLPERDPDRAVGRARARRRHRRAAAAAGLVAVVGVGAAVVVPSLGSEPTDPLSVASPGGSGLVPTGPLDLDWRPAEGGLSNVRAGFQADDGTVYALSTGPGARFEDHPDGDVPEALYRLTDAGTWEPVPLDGDRPRATDMAGAEGLLYAVSTAPAAGGDGTTVRLSTSDDRGDTWSSEDLDPVDPPSTVVEWDPSTMAAVESNGSTTLAVVRTAFYPDVESLFPELDSESNDLVVEQRDEGLVLVRYDPEEMVVEADAGTRQVRPNGEEAEPTQAEGQTDTPPGPTEGEGTDIRTVPWADLGVDGPEALNGRTQLFRWTGDGWEAIDGGAEALNGIGAVDLQVAGDRFVASGWTQAGNEPAVLTSTDGVSWAPASVPGDGEVVSVGPALVQTPWEGTVVHVSGDGGTTWDEVDLVDAGVGDGGSIVAADGGPLGLALAVQYFETDRPADLVVSGDLADWTVTPVPDIVDLEGATGVTTVVGEDRIVVTASEAPDGSSVPESATAVGTPVRAG